MLTLLCLICKDMPKRLWQKFWVCYDNMCNVMKMRAAKKDLPEQFGEFRDVWKYVNKMIDGLHISNHKSSTCQEQLGPHRLDEMYPDLKKSRNSMAAEQVFSWAGRFKKILSVMPNKRHIFYLHRMIIRRNAYTATCLRSRRRVLLPKVRIEFSS